MEPSNPLTFVVNIHLTNQHYLLAHATHVCSLQEHNID